MVENIQSAGGDWLMKIALEGATVRVRREVDARLLGAVLRALKG